MERNLRFRQRKRWASRKSWSHGISESLIRTAIRQGYRVYMRFPLARQRMPFEYTGRSKMAGVILNPGDAQPSQVDDELRQAAIDLCRPSCPGSGCQGKTASNEGTVGHQERWHSSGDQSHCTTVDRFQSRSGQTRSSVSSVPDSSYMSSSGTHLTPRSQDKGPALPTMRWPWRRQERCTRISS